jgi:3-phenylpropionate/trans-cinnamate dioxygenase ferredoxin component
MPSDPLPVLGEDELPTGRMVTVEFRGERVLVVNSAGRLYAMGAVCRHAEWDLSEGSLAGTKVTCAGHGAVWDLATGTAEFDEDLEPEPLYEAFARDGKVFLARRD